MWACRYCHARNEDRVRDCPRCGHSAPAQEVLDPVKEAEIAAKIGRAGQMQCLRCGCWLQYMGKKKFHEGSRQWGFWLGDLGELFTNREEVDFYGCSKCGKIEMFLDGVGEQYRSEG